MTAKKSTTKTEAPEVDPTPVVEQVPQEATVADVGPEPAAEVVQEVEPDPVPETAEAEPTGVVADAQRALNRLYAGLAPIRVTGEVDQATQDRVRYLQRKHGIEETGAFDRPVLGALGLG